MKWTKVNRNCVVLLTDLPNIGKAMAEDLRLIGIREPGQLVSRSPYEMYETLCKKTGSRHDPLFARKTENARARLSVN
jgi:hypothetical protein